MKKQPNVTISGAGIAGLTLALLLAEAGLTTAIIEPMPPVSLKDYKPTGRTAALWAGSVDLIKRTGIWDTIIPYVAPLRTMKIVDHRDNNTETLFESRDIDRTEFGYNIPNTVLRSALYAKAKKTKAITLHASQEFKSYEMTPNTIKTHLNKKKTIESALLIGADGRNSPVRTAANIKTRTHDYGQRALTFIINHSQAHNDTSTEFHKTGGPLALVPMPGNQSAVVWVERTERANALLKLRKQDLQQALQSIIGNTVGGITLETGPQSWPLHSITAKTITAPRIALIAESAHVMPPISAQGLNLSLRDVKDLADVITHHHALGLDIGSQTTLKDYAKRRRADIATRTTGVSVLNTLVAQDKPFLQNIRSKTLKTIDMIDPLKKQIMKKGLG